MDELRGGRSIIGSLESGIYIHDPHRPEAWSVVRAQEVWALVWNRLMDQ